MRDNEHQARLASSGGSAGCFSARSRSLSSFIRRTFIAAALILALHTSASSGANTSRSSSTESLILYSALICFICVLGIIPVTSASNGIFNAFANISACFEDLLSRFSKALIAPCETPILGLSSDHPVNFDNASCVRPFASRNSRIVLPSAMSAH